MGHGFVDHAAQIGNHGEHSNDITPIAHAGLLIKVLEIKPGNADKDEPC